MPKRHVIYHRPAFSFSRHWEKIIVLFIVSVLVILYPGQNRYVVSLFPISAKQIEIPFAIPTPAPYPVNTGGFFPGSEVSASGVVVLDADARVFLYKRNELSEFAPASTTKIMTALVALDYYGLDTVLTVGGIPQDGQKMGLVTGEKISVENLLYGALIHSGNDAAFTIAEQYPGGVVAFVGAMNAKAKALHLTGSVFTNSVGYDDPNQKMTAIDLSILSLSALTNKTIAKMVAIPAITVSDVTHTYFHPLKNVNALLGKIPGVGGIKTGWTTEAGENLVTLMERDGHRIIFVVLHSTDRFGDTEKLINWAFGNYRWENIK